jgi:hypothetical protein
VSQNPNFYLAYNKWKANPQLVFSDMKAWGADTVRMQISGFGADPTGGQYNAQFVSDFVGAVQYARSIGLNVIVSVQYEFQACEGPTIPNASTVAVWQNLTTLLNGDTGIMYEIFNEPAVSDSSGYYPTAADWNTYNNGANSVISAIRKSTNLDGTTAQNVIVTDGLHEGQTFVAIVPVTDTLNPAQVVNSVHPYFHPIPSMNSTTEDSANWPALWGNLSATARSSRGSSHRFPAFNAMTLPPTTPCSCSIT